MTDLAQKILGRDTRALARAATWIEDRLPEAEALLQELFPHTGHALVWGVTGPPGAGKSTLCDQLAAALRAEGKTAAIIAVDPTSPFSGGALLGDRVRMQRHHADPGVFIRSMATRGWLGGLARATFETTLLLDAAGFDVILVETVGAGQDEIEIARVADVTVVVLVPGMGDDVQAIKAGMMEIAQVFVINKSDLPGTDRLERELKAYLSLPHGPESAAPRIVAAIAKDGRGIADTLAAVRDVAGRASNLSHKAEMWSARLREMVRERVLDRIPPEQFAACGRDVAERRRDPYSILHEWLRKY